MLRRVNSSARGSSPCSSLSAAASSWTERGQLVRQGADQGSVSVDCKHGGLLILSPGGRVLDRGAGERAGRQRCGGGAREEGGNVVDLPVACGPHPAHPATVRTRVLSGAGTEGSAEMLGARLDSASTRGRVSLSPAGGRICGIRRLPLHQDERAQPLLPGDRPKAEVPGGDLPLGPPSRVTTDSGFGQGRAGHPGPRAPCRWPRTPERARGSRRRWSFPCLRSAQKGPRAPASATSMPVPLTLSRTACDASHMDASVAFPRSRSAGSRPVGGGTCPCESVRDESRMRL